MIYLRWLLLWLPMAGWAQAPFEIQVFEYEPLPRGAFTYDAHVNYVPNVGTAHFSSEWTAGLNDEVRLGMMVLTAAVPGRGMEYAGFRVLPHLYAPQSWKLPVNLGVVAEFSFEQAAFAENPRRVELRAIVERHIGRLQLDGNIVFERALQRPGTREGWEIEPSGRMGWQAWRRLTPSIEYYGAPRDRVQLLLPGADWKIGERLTWSFGVGLSATDAGSWVVLKSRLEYEFGRKSHTGQ